MKTLIVHRSQEHFDQEAVIEKCYEKPEKITADKLVQMVDEYNKNEKNRDRITIVDVDDNGLEMYLLRKARTAVMYQKDAVEDAIESASRLLDDLRSLPLQEGGAE